MSILTALPSTGGVANQNHQVQADITRCLAHKRLRRRSQKNHDRPPLAPPRVAQPLQPQVLKTSKRSNRSELRWVTGGSGLCTERHLHQARQSVVLFVEWQVQKHSAPSFWQIPFSVPSFSFLNVSFFTMVRISN